MSSAVAEREVGAPGLVNGIADTEELAAPVPAALTATTVTAYVVPAVKPKKSQYVPVLVQVTPVPGVAVAKYEVIEEPPSESGAVQLTLMVPAPGVNVTWIGLEGTVLGVTLPEVPASEVPALLVATTSTKYVEPFTKPEKVQFLVVAKVVQVSPVDLTVAT